MSHDEAEAVARVEELSDAELEAIAAGKTRGPLMTAWNAASSVALGASRATGGGQTGFRGFLS